MKRVNLERAHIDSHAERIVEEGIVVIDNITEMPVYNEPYISKNYVIVISHSGYMESMYDMRPVHFSPHELAIVYPNHNILAHNSSEDYCCTIVVAAAEAYRDLSTRIAFRNRFHYEQNPALSLTDSQYSDIMKVIDAMRVIGNSGIPSRRLLMTSLLSVLLELVEHFRHQMGSEKDKAPQRISARFYEAIILHHKEHHSVAFYADKLCLSPKYFSDVIKQETGKSAKHWICHFLVTEAKKLLVTRKDLNIQEISALLGFEDQASFSRLFKNFTGLSPTVYRQGDESR